VQLTGGAASHCGLRWGSCPPRSGHELCQDYRARRSRSGAARAGTRQIPPLLESDHLDSQGAVDEALSAASPVSSSVILRVFSSIAMAR
jgi:hypothetical protein